MSELRFTEDHEWLRTEADGSVTVHGDTEVEQVFVDRVLAGDLWRYFLLVPGAPREVPALRSALAAYLGHGLTADQVWAANGSNEVMLHLLHEHRLGVHLVAVRASGLTPLEAIIAGPDGETDAVAFGWQPPYPSPGPIVRRLMWAESVADSLAGQAYARLDRAEHAERPRDDGSADQGVRPDRPTHEPCASGA